MHASATQRHWTAAAAAAAAAPQRSARTADVGRPSATEPPGGAFGLLLGYDTYKLKIRRSAGRPALLASCSTDSETETSESGLLSVPEPLSQIRAYCAPRKENMNNSSRTFTQHHHDLPTMMHPALIHLAPIGSYSSVQPLMLTAPGRLRRAIPGIPGRLTIAGHFARTRVEGNPVGVSRAPAAIWPEAPVTDKPSRFE